jgi:hypothetical protein
MERRTAGALERGRKAMGWKVSRCRNIQISELFFMETCDQAVMDFLAATDIGKFPAQVS